jgi:hypothetical protein
VDKRYPFAAQPAQITTGAYEGRNLVSLPKELIHQMAPDESRGPSYKNPFTHPSSPLDLKSRFLYHNHGEKTNRHTFCPQGYNNGKLTKSRGGIS